jgi:hypothetical protein
MALQGKAPREFVAADGHDFKTWPVLGVVQRILRSSIDHPDLNVRDRLGKRVRDIFPGDLLRRNLVGLTGANGGACWQKIRLRLAGVSARC